jgi:hypothetical protein
MKNEMGAPLQFFWKMKQNDISSISVSWKQCSEKKMNSIKTYEDLYSIQRSQKLQFSDFNVLMIEVADILKLELSPENSNELQTKLYPYCSTLSKRWRNSNRDHKTFLKKYGVWLKTKINFLSLGKARTPIMKLGPKPKDFKKSSIETKRRKVQHLLKEGPDVLTFASKVSLYNNGQRDAAKVLAYVGEENNNSVKTMKHLLENSNAESSVFSKEEALALIITCKLSRYQYNTIRSAAIDKGHNLYPSYYEVQKAKMECYPPTSAVDITDRGAKISLQPLLDLTANRLIQSLAVDGQESEKKQHLCLMSKWGCDGASGQSNYKQKFVSGDSEAADDSSVFMVSMVPIKLYDESTGKTIWSNPKPSSTALCRPISFVYQKETPELITTTVTDIKNQIEKLQPSIYEKNGYNVSVSHKMLLTMVDGKVCNVLAENSSTQRCYICKASPTEMNKLGEYNLCNYKIMMK